MVKKVSLLLILAFFSSRLIGVTTAFLTDSETSEENRFQAARLGLTVSSGQDNFVPQADNLVPGSVAARDIYLHQEDDSLPLRHRVSFQFLEGNPDLCGQINLKLWYNHYHGPVSAGYGNRDMRLKYDGPLSGLSNLTDDDFIIPHPDDYYGQAYPGTQWFYYRIEVPEDLADEFQEQSCRFNLVFTAWQADFSQPDNGFVDQEVLENNLTTVNWQRPSSEITSGEGLTNQLPINIDYWASDNADQVELWYSWNSSDWRLFGTDQPHSPGSFNFEPEEGDGVYRLITVAVSSFGRVEDKNGNDVDDNQELEEVAQFLEGEGLLYYLQIDSQPPTSNLVLGDFDQVNRWAGQNLLANGDFEGRDYSSWQGGGAGDHTVVGPEDAYQGNQAYLIGFRDNDAGEGEVDYVFQLVPLPERVSSSLSFWYRVISNDTVDYDWFRAEIRDQNDYPLERILLTGSDEVGPDTWSGDSGWREATHSLLDFAGRTVKIWFGVENHDSPSGEEKTWALIDNVVVTTGDNQLSPEAGIDFESHDGGSGVFDHQLEASASGEVNFSAEDVAGNQEATESAQVNILPSVVINKVVPNPTGADSGSSGLPLEGEWIELYNNTDEPIDVTGWYLYDADDSHELIIGSDNVDLDEDLTDDDDLPVIPARGWLRVYRNGDSDFSLNNDADQVRLYNGPLSEADLIDQFDYQADDYQETSLGEDWQWQRQPDGIGSWQLVKMESSWDFRLSYTNQGRKIWLSIFQLPEETQSVDYRIIYSHEGVETGIAGTVSADQIEAGKIDRQFVLGTCSAHGQCVYHQVDDNRFNLEITLTTGSGSETKSREIQL